MSAVRMLAYALILLSLLALEAGAPASEAPLRLGVSVLRSFEHDPGAYTQGLVFEDGIFFESSGRYRQSFVRRWRLNETEPDHESRLDDRYFAEGLARVDDRLIVLTWKAEEALVLDPETFESIGQYPYPGEGWGLCDDGRRLIMSDGTSTLSHRSREDFNLIRRVDVLLDGYPVSNLNELECAEGWVYANVFEKDIILRIDPNTGRVDAVVDASGLLRPSERRVAGVLNGIAYDAASETFFITGKLWPKIFQVKFVDR